MKTGARGESTDTNAANKSPAHQTWTRCEGIGRRCTRKPSVDLRRGKGRSPHVQDDVPGFVPRGVDAERHLGAPLPVHSAEDLREALAILLRQVREPEVEIELVLRGVAAIEHERDLPVQLVLEVR